MLVAGAGHAGDKGAAERDLSCEARGAGLAELAGVAWGTRTLLHPARPLPRPGASGHKLDLAQE